MWMCWMPHLSKLVMRVENEGEVLVRENLELVLALNLASPKASISKVNTLPV